MFKTIVILATALMLALAVAPTVATTWDLGSQFSGTTNSSAANNGWSYRYFSYPSSGEENLLLVSEGSWDNPVNIYNSNGETGLPLQSWARDGAHQQNPAIRKNGNDVAVDVEGTYWAPGQVAAEGASATMCGGAEWTSSITGSVTVTMTFTGITYGSATGVDGGPAYGATDSYAYFYKNYAFNGISTGTADWSAHIQGFAAAGGHDAITPGTATATYTTTFDVTQGDNLIFAASGYGWDGSKRQSNVGMSVTITSADVPEPGSLLVLGSGLIGLAGLIRRLH